MLEINSTENAGSASPEMHRRFRMFHVAKLYHVDHLKQAEIAKRLGISPMLVS